MVIKGSKIVIGTELVDALTIYKPIYDARDFKSKKIKASLLSDGTGIVFTEPSLPFFFTSEITQMHELEGRSSCASTLRKHTVVANAIKGNIHRQTKEVTLLFPDGMTCNNRHFNGNPNEFSRGLKSNFRMLEVQIDQDLHTNYMDKCNYVFWKVVIDGEAQIMETARDSDEDDEWNTAFERVEKLRISGANRAFEDPDKIDANA